MQCEICKKECKGKIGIGVHLKRSHTAEERHKLYMKHIFDIVPLIQVVVF